MTPDDAPVGHRCHLDGRTPHTATCLRGPHDDGNDWAVLLVVDANRLRRQLATEPPTPGPDTPAYPVPDRAADDRNGTPAPDLSTTTTWAQRSTALPTPNPLLPGRPPPSGPESSTRSTPPILPLISRPTARRGSRSTPDDGSRRITSTPASSPDTMNTNGSQEVHGHDPTLIRPTPTSPAVSPQDVPVRGQHRTVTRTAPPAKTSTAAVFALVFGLAALFCALTAILSPAAVLFGIIGLVLAVAGLKMAKRPGITGKSVAIGGLVTALLGLLLGGVVLGGLATVLNNKTQLDRIQSYLDKQQAKLPSAGDVRNSIPGQ